MRTFRYSLLLLGFHVLLIEGVLAQSIVQVIPLPRNSFYDVAWGLAADSNYLYLASNTSDATMGRKIMKLDFSGVPVDSFMLPPGINSNQGLARDGGGNFYFIRRYTSSCTILKVSASGVLIDSLRTNKYIGGAVWEGAAVRFSVYYPDNEAGLYLVSFPSHTFWDTIFTPTRQPYGVGFDGTYLYYVENGFQGEPRGVFKVNPLTRDTVGFIPEPQDNTANGTNPCGVALVGRRYMWLLGEPVGASSGRCLYKYDLWSNGTPRIAIEPTTIDFGPSLIRQLSYRDFAVRNIGTAPLRVFGFVAIVGNFHIPDTTFVLQPNQSAHLRASFWPVSYGPDSLTYIASSDDPVQPTSQIRLSGFGVYSLPTLDVPLGFDFGTRRAGSRNLWRMTLRNLGGDQLRVDSIRWGLRAYGVDPVTYPLVLDSLQRTAMKVWFYAPTGVALDTLKIYSNSTTGRVTNVWLRGSGDATPIPIGQPLWAYAVPDHPVSNTGRLVKAVRAIGNADGTGMRDIIISTENYWTMKVNGNSSVNTDSLWAFTTYISNYSAGSIGNNGEMSAQKGLSIARDLNGDGYNDVVIGTGGGNEHVYAINGRTGGMLWTFGTDAPDSFALGDIAAVDASTDFNGDGVPDVIASASATQSGGVGPRQKVYLFNGVNGTLLWSTPLIGFHHQLAVIPDINADGKSDVIATAGEPSYKAAAFSGMNGAPIWNFAVPSASAGAKEVFILPVQGQTADVIVGAYWGPIYRVDGETGTQVWSYSTGGRGVMQLARLRDINGDGIDEVLASLLLGGARCLNGATGQVVWSIPSGSGMGISAVRDLTNDGYDDVAMAIQDQGAVIVRGQDGMEIGRYPMGSNECREIAVVPDMDGNNSVEIIAGGKFGNVALVSGGTNAGPNSILVARPLPQAFELLQNYPNPFNPSTTIEVRLPHQADVSLRIFDVLGRMVASFEYERVPAGTHSVVWDGKDKRGAAVASGTYLYQMRSEGRVLTKSMVLLK